VKRLLLPLLALLLPAPALAEGLIDNVNGITLDKDGRVVRFTGLVVTNDGKVAKLLDRKDKRPERPDFKTDGKGRTLMPGIIDAHGHVMGVGFQEMILDLGDTRSLAEVQAKVAAYVQANPNRRWIIGGAGIRKRWKLGRFPTAAELDTAVSTARSGSTRVDGHAGWANSRAIAAGVTASDQGPTGGRIERARRQARGVFVDGAMALVEKSCPRHSARSERRLPRRRQSLLSLRHHHRSADMGTTLDDWMTYRRMGDNRHCSRCASQLCRAASTHALAVGGQGPTPWLYDDRLRMGGDQALFRRRARLARRLAQGRLSPMPRATRDWASSPTISSST
jgi:predicted amidohydrolase YtcJ